MNFFNKECVLFLTFICCFAVPILLILNLDVPSWCSGSWIAKQLVDTKVKDIALGLSLSYIAAYIFYVINEYWPRRTRKANALKVLDHILASIPYTYDQCKVFGHELAINHVPTTNLNIEWLSASIAHQKQNLNLIKGWCSELKEYGKVNIPHKFANLFFALSTADTRLNYFRDALPLVASETDPAHVLQWLVITDKVKLLAESSITYPAPDSKDPEEMHKCLLEISSASFRLMEFLEEVRAWILLPSQR